MTSSGSSSVFAGFRFPREVISLAVRWYLRYGLSYRDVEELLAERGITDRLRSGASARRSPAWQVHRDPLSLARAARQDRITAAQLSGMTSENDQEDRSGRVYGPRRSGEP